MSLTTTPRATEPGGPNPYRGHRAPREGIAHAVRLSLRFALSVRDVEAILAERDITVSSETVRRWVATCGAPYAAERRRQAPRGRTWHLDETAVRVGGRRPWRWRAVDERGQTLDVLRPAQRDPGAAERVFRRPLAATNGAPPARITARITTDQRGSDAAALTRGPALCVVEPRQVRSARRCNTRGVPAHHSTRVRERVMRRFRASPSAQRFLDAFTRVATRRRPGRHLRSAAASRAAMRERVATWREGAGLRAAERTPGARRLGRAAFARPSTRLPGINVTEPYGGRRPSIDPAEVRRLREEERLGPAAIARRLGIGRASVYRVLGSAPPPA